MNPGPSVPQTDALTKLRHSPSGEGQTLSGVDPDLRTPESATALDAIHLAAAIAIRDDLDVFVTYDGRLAAAAEAEGFRVESPR